MMRKTAVKYLGVVAGVSLAAACDIPVEHDYNNTIESTPPVTLEDRNYAPPGPGDAPIDVPETTNLSGAVKNYLTQQYVGDVEVYTAGVTPPVSQTADGQGAFTMDIPTGSVFYARTYKSGYMYTYERVDMTQPLAAYTQNLYILSQTDINAMATAFGKTQNPSCGMLLVSARNQAGQPQANVNGITLAGVDYEGPYYLNDQNQAYPGATYTSASGNMVFFNVCDTGSYAITNGKNVQVQATGTYAGAPQYVSVYAGGISLGKMYVQENGTPPPPPDPYDVIDFPAEIMPIFAKYACQSCHTEGGSAAGTGLYFDDYPENVYYKLYNDAQVVNLQYPSQSYLLTKPLYEEPPNHPNASFYAPSDPDYVALLQWIESGAPYGVDEAPEPVVNVDFYADVYPIFQNRGCAACHNTANPSGGLDLTGGADVVYPRLVNYNLYDLNYPDRSSLLRNPYCGPDYCANDQYPETHPTRVFYTTDDPDYVKILLWVTQGAYYEVEVVVDPNLQTNVDFASQIQYRFTTRGCVGCHSKENPSGGLSLVGTPYEVYQAAKAQVVVGDYEGSYLYTKPNAYYANVNHGGPKQIPNKEDPYALYVGGWIYEGANFVDPGPVDFATDVYPLFQTLGCTGCHGANGGSGGLNLQGDPQVIYTNYVANVVNAGYPAQSELLTKSFDVYANVNHGGGKKAVNQYYTQYQTIANWISEGAYYQPQ